MTEQKTIRVDLPKDDFLLLFNVVESARSKGPNLNESLAEAANALAEAYGVATGFELAVQP